MAPKPKPTPVLSDAMPIIAEALNFEIAIINANPSDQRVLDQRLLSVERIANRLANQCVAEEINANRKTFDRARFFELAGCQDISKLEDDN